jgi:hypothetical protein
MTILHGPAAGPWQHSDPRMARALVGHLPVRWWVAGGWALDLFLGEQSRAHKDLDVGILRRDLPQVLAALPKWEFFEARAGELFGPLTGQAREDVNSLWGRRAHSKEWTLELMLDDAEGDEWVFRRDRSIRRALDTLVRHDGEGIPYLVPEVQLLYKASHTREEDQADFTRVAVRLDASSRGWLSRALGRVSPRHPWLSVLGASA